MTIGIRVGLAGKVVQTGPSSKGRKVTKLGLFAFVALGNDGGASDALYPAKP